LTTSLSIILFFWEKVIEQLKIKVVTILFMIILRIITIVNYSYRDKVWKLELQTLLDYVNAFWGLIVL